MPWTPSSTARRARPSPSTTAGALALAARGPRATPVEMIPAPLGGDGADWASPARPHVRPVWDGWAFSAQSAPAEGGAGGV